MLGRKIIVTGSVLLGLVGVSAKAESLTSEQATETQETSASTVETATQSTTQEVETTTSTAVPVEEVQTPAISDLKVEKKQMVATKSAPLYKDETLADTIGGDTSANQVYQVKGSRTINGDLYYLVQRKGVEGYVKADTMAAFKKTSIKPKLLTAVKEYSYYRNFEWSVKGKLTIGRTYQTDGYYTLNGNRYYSIYRKDSNGNNKWYGYVNAKAVKDLVGTKSERLVVAKKEYKRYSDFFWKDRGKTKKDTLYKVKYVYQLGDGKRYYSLYREDNKGKESWYGYANVDAFSALPAKSEDKLVTAKKEYKRYSSFFWKERGKTTVGNVYQSKGYYVLGNGRRYLSLYDKNDKWYGYVNAGYTAPADHSAYYFSQKDERWNKYYVRNTNSTMYDIGCAPTSLAMALNIMHKDENYTDPWKVADTLARVGVLSDYGTNADYTVLPKALGSIGLNARYISNSDSAMRSALKNKHMILLNGAGQNPFTAYGHYILASTISSDGKVYILDPWNENNNGWWSMSTLRSRGLTRCFEIWAK